jgi:hypothetical protein
VIWGLERVPEGVLPQPGEDLAGQALAERVLLAQAATLNALGLGGIGLGLALAKRSAPDIEAVTANADAGMPHQGAFGAFALADRGDLVGEFVEPSLEAARRRGVPLAVSGSHGTRAISKLLDGELAEAGGDADIAMNILRGVPLPAVVGVWAGGAIRIATSRGDFSAAGAMLADPWGEQGPPTRIPAAIFLCAASCDARPDARPRPVTTIWRLPNESPSCLSPIRRSSPGASV